MKKQCLIFCLFLCALCFSSIAEEPWSVSVYSPVIKKSSEKHKHKHQSPMMSFYQKYVSSFDGPRCSLSPTCSAYAADSFRQHGYVMGFILMSDRLMHESAKVNFLKIKQPHAWLHDWEIGHTRYDWQAAMFYFQFSPRFKDSVSDNTFWWND